jgi:cation:H+ antiporter
LSDFSTPWLFILLAIGMFLLIRGADWLVDGSSALALRAGVSPFMVGMTIVAFGTSAPELAASVAALLQLETHPDHGQLAIANVVGSNICNLALVLGVTAIVAPIAVASKRVRREVPVLALLTAVLAACIWFSTINLWVGLLLLAIFGVFFGGVFRRSLRRRRLARENRAAGEALEAVEVEDDEDIPEMSTARALASVGLGCLFLPVGATLLVDAAESLATRLHVPEEFIGLTLVSLGTSLPELATTVVAARRGRQDLALGNVIGSNIFNIGIVVGLPSLFLRWPVDGPALHGDLLVMLGLTALVGGVAARRGRLSRRSGVVLAGIYTVYMSYLVYQVVQAAPGA